MSLYHLQKFLFELNREEQAQEKYKDDLSGLIGEYDLTDEESAALREVLPRSADSSLKRSSPSAPLPNSQFGHALWKRSL